MIDSTVWLATITKEATMSGTMREAYEAMMIAYEAVKKELQNTILAYLREHRGEKIQGLFHILRDELDIPSGLLNLFRHDFDKAVSNLIARKLILGIWESSFGDPNRLFIPEPNSKLTMRVWACNEKRAEAYVSQLRTVFYDRYDVVQLTKPRFCNTSAELYIDGREAIIRHDEDGGPDKISQFIATAFHLD